MYPLLRLFTTLIKAKASKPLGIEAVCESSFYCMPWDMDIFLELNNGRALTLYDLGRFNLSIRLGLAKVLKAKRWGLVVAGSTVRYRKRIKMFDKVIMQTQVAGSDNRWIYITQSMWVKSQPCSSVLLRTGITSKEGIVPPDDVLKAINITQSKPIMSDWEKSWIASEELRPWPPSP